MTAEKKERQTRGDRMMVDAAIEARFTFHKDDIRETTLAYVATHRDELVEEFFLWLSGNTDQNLREGMAFWQVKRFGNELPPVATAILRYAVRRKQEHGPKFNDPHWSSKAEQEAVEAAAYMLEDVKGEGSESKVRRICAEGGLKVDGMVLKPMPENRLPYKDPPEDAPVPGPAPEHEPGCDDEPPDWLED